MLTMDGPDEKEVNTQCPWRVEEADEARYNFSDQKGLWQPKPDDILSVFEQLAKGGSLPLKWTCPGRRPPDSDVPNESEMETSMEAESDQMKEEYLDPEPSTFDFDDTGPDVSTKVTPWRSHTGMARTPKTEKRVARMDNIMDSLRKQQIQRAAEREARKTKVGTPSRVQQGRGRLIKFGSPTLPKKSSPVTLNDAPVSSTPSLLSDSTHSGAVSTSSSAVTVSASSTAPSGKDNLTSEASTMLPVSNPSGTSGVKLEEQEVRNSVEAEGNDVKIKSDESGSDLEEDVTNVSTMVSSSSSSSVPVASKSAFVTISSNQNKMLTTSNTLPALGYPGEEQKDISSRNISSSATPTAAISSSDITSASNSNPQPPPSHPSPTVTLPSLYSDLSSTAATTTNTTRTSSPSFNGSSAKFTSGSIQNSSTDLTDTEQRTTELPSVTSLTSKSIHVASSEYNNQTSSFQTSASSTESAMSTVTQQSEVIKPSDSSLTTVSTTVNVSSAPTSTAPSFSSAESKG